MRDKLFIFSPFLLLEILIYYTTLQEREHKHNTRRQEILVELASLRRKKRCP